MKKIKNSCLAFLLWSIPFMALSAPDQIKADPNFYPNLLVYLLGGIAALVIIGGLFSLYRLLNLTLWLQKQELVESMGIALEEENVKAPKESWWKRLNEKLTDAVPVERETDILLDHNYDGIKELDNNLPPWWVYGFYLTIIIGVVYIGIYHFSDYGKSMHEYYAIEMEQAAAAKARFLARQANSIDESNVILLTDEISLAAGKSIFDANCIVCHLESGGGAPNSVGPNLTDPYWLHGGGVKNVFKTIKYGVPDKGMISWKNQMRPTDIQKVASYIISLEGTNPPNPRAPQGDLWESEEGEKSSSQMAPAKDIVGQIQ